ncbi:hypothetical protein Ddye_014597 [Dipteronia dyeriana]|uniref:RNase H type-1 domain-containing protein n=1 Tax=Dipteronia dyeriana TaxID=168575 RepID=A0AAD9X8N1_9ROSI|nr:hypothetical protein Ddye_014597 [Dipteronia dyeriana]
MGLEIRSGGQTLVEEGVKLQKSVADTIAWSFCQKGLYSISFFRRCVEDFGDEDVSKFDKVWCGNEGIGDVLHDSYGVVFCSFSASVGKVDGSTAELMAIHKACLLYFLKGLLSRRSVLIESDSKVVLSWLKDCDFGNLALMNIIYEIRSMLHTYGNLLVSYASRDSNMVADGLAKKGLFTDGECVVWNLAYPFSLLFLVAVLFLFVPCSSRLWSAVFLFLAFLPSIKLAFQKKFWSP